MEQDLRTDAAPTAPAVTTTTAAPVEQPDATGDRPETLAEALGENGPGIAAEIEAELSGTDSAEPSGTDSADLSQGASADLSQGASADLSQGASADLSDRLGLLSTLQVTLTARLCATSQPLGAVLSMKPGTIVDLGRDTSGPIELLANGVVVAYGEVVAVGSTLGVRVTKIAP